MDPQQPQQQPQKPPTPPQPPQPELAEPAVQYPQAAPEQTPQYAQPQQPVVGAPQQYAQQQVAPSPAQEYNQQYATDPMQDQGTVGIVDGAEQLDDEEDYDPQDAVSWEASEFVHHDKDAMWFIGILAAAVLLSLLSVFLLRSWTFTILIVVMAVSLIVLSRRPPRTLRYQLNHNGLAIDQKQYQFQDFRAFGVVQDGPFYHVTLLPAKRLMPSIDVYFPEEQGEQIVDIFGAHVPMQTIQLDFIDRLSKQLRF